MTETNSASRKRPVRWWAITLTASLGLMSLVLMLSSGIAWVAVASIPVAVVIITLGFVLIERYDNKRYGKRRYKSERDVNTMSPW